jgi:hypothetical protein
MMSNSLFAQAFTLGAAIWFLLWCVARSTKEIVYENDPTRYGSVLGGMPVNTDRVGTDFPEIGERTINRWRKVCVKEGVIRTKRTPIGYIIEVVGSAKFSNKIPEKRKSWTKKTEHSESDRTEMSHHLKSELQFGEVRLTENANHSESELRFGEVHIDKKGLREKKEEKKEGTSPAAPALSIDSKAKGSDKEIKSLVKYVQEELYMVGEGRLALGPKQLSLVAEAITEHLPTRDELSTVIRKLVGPMDYDEMKFGGAGKFATNLGPALSAEVTQAARDKQQALDLEYSDKKAMARANQERDKRLAEIEEEAAAARSPF